MGNLKVLEKLKEVRALWVALLAVAAMFSAGMTTATITSRVTECPVRLDVLELDVTANHAAIDTLRIGLRELKQMIQTQLCLDIVDRRGGDWRECVYDQNLSGVEIP
jgi:hypothetical protein